MNSSLLSVSSERKKTVNVMYNSHSWPPDICRGRGPGIQPMSPANHEAVVAAPGGLVILSLSKTRG